MQGCENYFYESMFVQLRTHDLLAEYVVVVFFTRPSRTFIQPQYG